MKTKFDVAHLDVRLSDAGAREECSICGRVNWTVDDDPAGVTALDPDSGEAVLVPAVPAIIMVCRNCGFIRLHAIDVLFGDE